MIVLIDESSEHETEPFPSPQPPVATRVRFESDGSLSPPSEDGPCGGDSLAATTAAAVATRVDPLAGGDGLTDSTWHSVIKREQVEKEEAVENASRLEKKIEYLEETLKVVDLSIH